jgi:CoA:oxalate CoA-transferase
MARLGLDHAAVAEINPRLVYCSISGFGQTGPLAGRSAYAPIVHACSGFDLANLSYQDGIERPLNSGLFIADVLGGALAFGAIQAALLARARTGRGDWIDLSLLDAMLGLQVYECQEAQFASTRRRPLYQPLRASDGFVIVAPVSQGNFEDLAAAVGEHGWMQDPRFATIEAREQNWALLMELLEGWTFARTAHQCEELLNAAGVPCARYVTPREAIDHPHLKARGSFATIDDGSGPFRVTNPAFRFAGATAQARDRVAGHGADGRDVLAATLGYTAAEIDALIAADVLVQN